MVSLMFVIIPSSLKVVEFHVSELNDGLKMIYKTAVAV